MSYSDQLVQSGARLRSQGLLFVQQTGQAGTAFATETQEASVAFADRMTDAAMALLTTVSTSTVAFGRACRHEALDWADLSIKTKQAYVKAFQARLSDLETAAQNAQQALEPKALQARLLKTTSEVLDDAQQRVGARLEQAKTPVLKVAPKATARPSRKKTGRAPIRNYDQLTAKDVVGRIQRLSGPQATAVLDYEQSRKNRATVIRAAKQRLATG